MSVNHRNFLVSLWQAATFVLKFWTLNWCHIDRSAQASDNHFQSSCLVQIIMSSCAAAAARSTWHTSVKLLSRLCESSDASSWFIFTGQYRSNVADNVCSYLFLVLLGQESQHNFNFFGKIYWYKSTIKDDADLCVCTFSSYLKEIMLITNKAR